jgi:hypothetical protein
VSQVTDVTVRAAAARVRTAADSVSQVTDVANRALQAFARTAADTVSQITDAAIKGGGLAIVRTASDSVSQVTDSTVRGLMSLLRTAVDGPTVSEVANRVVSGVRTASDVLAALSDAASQHRGLFKTASDGVSQITDVTTRGAQHLVRTATESVSRVLEAAQGIVTGSGTFNVILRVGRPVFGWVAKAGRGWKADPPKTDIDSRM